MLGTQGTGHGGKYGNLKHLVRGVLLKNSDKNIMDNLQLVDYEIKTDPYMCNITYATKDIQPFKTTDVIE